MTKKIPSQKYFDVTLLEILTNTLFFLTYKTDNATKDTKCSVLVDENFFKIERHGLIYDGDSFLDFNGRKNARCSKCFSMERNRLLSMFFDKLGLSQQQKKVLHFSPQYDLSERLLNLFGDSY